MTIKTTYNEIKTKKKNELNSINSNCIDDYKFITYPIYIIYRLTQRQHVDCDSRPMVAYTPKYLHWHCNVHNSRYPYRYPNDRCRLPHRSIHVHHRRHTNNQCPWHSKRNGNDPPELEQLFSIYPSSDSNGNRTDECIPLDRHHTIHRRYTVHYRVQHYHNYLQQKKNLSNQPDDFKLI